MTIVLRAISARSAGALLAGRPPDDVVVAPDHPTEFSAGVAGSMGNESPLGPYFIHRAADGVVVGEIGAVFVAPGTVEVGYALVASCWGLGYATEAVLQLVDRARELPEVARILAHTPLDRPASGRVLEKAGFTPLGEIDDEHEGATLRVREWELVL